MESKKKILEIFFFKLAEISHRIFQPNFDKKNSGIERITAIKFLGDLLIIKKSMGLYQHHYFILGANFNTNYTYIQGRTNCNLRF